MISLRPVTVEATAVAKGIELTHGNSFHYLTFELDSGERVYFQVSMKCYMLIVEGDRCIITYKDNNLAKKKLKSFERILNNSTTQVIQSVTELDTDNDNTTVIDTQMLVKDLEENTDLEEA